MQDLGRRFFGFASIFLGMAKLINHDFASVWEPVPDGMPGRTAAAIFAALVFIAAGFGLQWRRTVRLSATALALIYVAFVALWLRRVLGYPEIFATWGGTAEELVPLLGALVLLFEANRANDEPRLALLRTCSLLYGLCVIAFGINHFFAMTITASLVPSWIPPSQWTWALLTGIFDVLGGLAIIIGVFAATSARLLTLMYLGFAVLIWIPRMFNDPGNIMTWMGNGVNFSIIGAAWVFADLLARREREFGPIVPWPRRRAESIASANGRSA